MTNTIEAAIVFENGRLRFVAADTRQHGSKTGPVIKGIAYADLKADVSPHGHDPEEIYFVGVYACSHFSDFFVALEGQDRKDAEAILIGNAEWLEWAREEIAQRRAA